MPRRSTPPTDSVPHAHVARVGAMHGECRRYRALGQALIDRDRVEPRD